MTETRAMHDGRPAPLRPAPHDRVGLYIDPPTHHFLADRLFTLKDGRYQSSLTACYATLREVLTARGIRVHTADYLPTQPEVAHKIYVSMGMLTSYRAFAQRRDTTLSALVAMECPIVEPSLYRGLSEAQRYFKRIYSWSDSEALRPFLTGPVRLEPLHWPQPFDRVDRELWGQSARRFLVMINANKRPRLYRQELYTERVRAVASFSRHDEIDLYGVGWDEPPYRLGRGWIPRSVQHASRALEKQWRRWRPDPLLEAARRAYRGPVDSKPEVLARYTFSLCFENMVLRGWITEKIFDCFFTGTIPIYWGAPDIAQHVPPECFIDMRRFAGYDELRDYLRSLDAEQIRRYKEAARDYVGSARFRPFTKQAFIDLFMALIEQDAGVRL